MTISQRIFTILKEKHLSQKKLSVYTGISPAAISSWKSKNTNPSADKIIKICEFLDVSPYYLLTGRNDTVPDHLILQDSAGEYQSFISDEEFELLSLFRQLSDIDKGRILGILESTANVTEKMK